MSFRRRFAGPAALLFLIMSSCASGSSDTAPPAPTSVPPALAFAEDIETLTAEAGLWTEVASNDDLAACLRAGAGSEAESVENLRADIEELDDSGFLIIADCLTGA